MHSLVMFLPSPPHSLLPSLEQLPKTSSPTSAAFITLHWNISQKLRSHFQALPCYIGAWHRVLVHSLVSSRLIRNEQEWTWSKTSSPPSAAFIRFHWNISQKLRSHFQAGDRSISMSTWFCPFLNTYLSIRRLLGSTDQADPSLDCHTFFGLVSSLRPIPYS